jgi:hypothetical protein
MYAYKVLDHYFWNHDKDRYCIYNEDVDERCKEYEIFETIWTRHPIILDKKTWQKPIPKTNKKAYQNLKEGKTLDGRPNGPFFMEPKLFKKNFIEKFTIYLNQKQAERIFNAHGWNELWKIEIDYDDLKEVNDPVFKNTVIGLVSKFRLERRLLKQRGF